MKRSVVTRQQVTRRPGLWICGNPLHSDWGSSDSSRKADPVRKSVLDVLSAIGRWKVVAICRDCRRTADQKREVTKHSLYSQVSNKASSLTFFLFAPQKNLDMAWYFARCSLVVQQHTRKNYWNKVTMAKLSRTHFQM